MSVKQLLHDCRRRRHRDNYATSRRILTRIRTCTASVATYARRSRESLATVKFTRDFYDFRASAPDFCAPSETRG